MPGWPAVALLPASLRARRETFITHYQQQHAAGVRPKLFSRSYPTWARRLDHWPPLRLA